MSEAETQTTPEERDCVFRYASGCKTAAEIGVWHGVTTLRILGGMSPQGKLFAVDPYPKGRFGFSSQRIIARRTVNPHCGGRVIWVRKTGVDAARDSDIIASAPFDFLFIDGDHSYEGLRGDWESWSEMIAIGGFVALHDSCSTPSNNIDSAGSVRYTNEAIRNDSRFTVVEVVDTLTVVRRN